MAGNWHQYGCLQATYHAHPYYIVKQNNFNESPSMVLVKWKWAKRANENINYFWNTIDISTGDKILNFK